MLLKVLRVHLPLAVCFAGVVVAAVRGFDDTGLDAAGALFGAGASIWLMNVLLRVGVTGDRERDREDAARDFYDRHGLWPDEVPPGWTPPPPPEEAPPPRRPDPHKRGPATSGGRGSRRGRGGRGR